MRFIKLSLFGSAVLIVMLSACTNSQQRNFQDRNQQNNQANQIEEPGGTAGDAEIARTMEPASLPTIEPTLAPTSVYTNGNLILFASDISGNWEIYSIEINSKEVRNLTDSSFYDVSPSWSPDGSLIAFISDRADNDKEIYVMNADGSGVRRLTYRPGLEEGISWSPNGDFIVFTGYNDDPNIWSDIFRIETNGEGLRNLTNTGVEKRGNWYADVSPDGSKIAYKGEGGITVMDINGSNKTTIVFDVDKTASPPGSYEGPTLVRYNSPSWTNDNQHLVFESLSQPPPRKDVLLTDLNGNITQLTNREEADRLVGSSPSGDQIAITSTVNDDSDLYLIDVNGQNRQRITNFEETVAGGSWSPEGNGMAITTQDDQNHMALYIVEFNGSNSIQLVSLEGSIYYVSWQPMPR